jgi:hypothetical protein
MISAGSPENDPRTCLSEKRKNSGSPELFQFILEMAQLMSAGTLKR